MTGPTDPPEPSRPRSPADDVNPFEAPRAVGEAATLLVDAYWPRTRAAWWLVGIVGLLGALFLILGALLLGIAQRRPAGGPGLPPPTGPALVAVAVGSVLGVLAALLAHRVRQLPPSLRFFREGIELRIFLKRRWRLAVWPFPARLAWDDLMGASVTGRFLGRKLRLVAVRLAFDPARLRGAAVPPFWVVGIAAAHFQAPLDRVVETVKTYRAAASTRAHLPSWDDPPPPR